MKDYLCLPRPVSPPVARISKSHPTLWNSVMFNSLHPQGIASHHLEYGMPSTHSANSVSTALFLLLLTSDSGIPTLLKYALYSILLVYVSSVVLGRIYCGMHGPSDCIIGIVLGSANVAVDRFAGDYIEDAMAHSTMICEPFLLLRPSCKR